MLQLDKKISRNDKRLINRVMLVAAVVYPLTAIPQVYVIFSTKDASGVSLSTWIGFILFGIIYLLYAIIHRLTPNIISQILWLTIEVIIVVGVFMYR
jgi:uncharacterized protein with PQ loop repeat